MRNEISLYIDNRKITACKSDTIWLAAKRAGINIPSLCRTNSPLHQASCMLCLVENQLTGKLIPSCSAPAKEGMKIRSLGTDIENRRKISLEWLLEEHRGECFAPCSLGCPARPDIPRIQRSLRHGDISRALELFLQSIPLPGIMGLICPAPCEKACRRGRIDKSLRIKDLEYLITQATRATEIKNMNTDKKPGHWKILVVGSGPAGLAAADYLADNGNDVHIIDSSNKPGGNLQKALDLFKQGEQIFNMEISRLLNKGITIEFNCAWGIDLNATQTNNNYQAVLFAIGKMADEQTTQSLDIPHESAFINTQKKTMAIKAMANGKKSAMALMDKLKNKNRVLKLNRKMNKISSLGPLMDNDYMGLLTLSTPKNDQRTNIPINKEPEKWIQTEAQRCLLCGCDKDDLCQLKKLAEDFEIKGKSGSQRIFKRQKIGTELVYEQGKCIKCGKCRLILKNAGFNQGPAFLGTGKDMEIEFLFTDDNQGIPLEFEKELAQSCPTGALFLLNPILKFNEESL